MIGFFRSVQSVTPATTGPFGKSFDPSQVSSGRDGLSLVVQHNQGEANVRSAQLQSYAENILFGTFRAVMKLPTTPGTCAALFYFLNDREEIDMEFLSSFAVGTASVSPFNFFGTQTGDRNQVYNPLAWKVIPYAEQQTSSFVEYRFDWSPSHVDYFIAGAKEHSTQLGVPQNPGLIIINHWSTGAVGWELGPPTAPATLVLQSFKAYYNSTYDPKTCFSSSKPSCRF